MCIIIPKRCSSRLFHNALLFLLINGSFADGRLVITMKFFMLRASLLLSAVQPQSTQPARSRNVQIAADGTIIATSLDRGPLLLEIPDEHTISIELPGGIVSMDDIVISHEGWLFGLSVYTPVLCSFRMVTASIEAIGCVSGNFSLNTYTGMAAKGGTCVISGGAGGYTVVEYDRETGMLAPTLRCLNCEIEVKDNSIDDLNLVEVALLDSRFASFSAIAGEGSIDRTNHVSIVMNLNNNQVSTLHPAPNPPSTDLAATGTNYPFVSDFYRSASGEDFMFTACGRITVQSVVTGNSTSVISPPVQDFSAVTLMVDRARHTLVVGGRVMNDSYIASYEIDAANPRNTAVDLVAQVDGTILALAIRDGRLAYVTAENPGIATNLLSPQPSGVPSEGPSHSPSSSVSVPEEPKSVGGPKREDRDEIRDIFDSPMTPRQTEREQQRQDFLDNLFR